jgi:hypothetical protein
MRMRLQCNNALTDCYKGDGQSKMTESSGSTDTGRGNELDYQLDPAKV